MGDSRNRPFSRRYLLPPPCWSLPAGAFLLLALPLLTGMTIDENLRQRAREHDLADTEKRREPTPLIREQNISSLKHELRHRNVRRHGGHQRTGAVKRADQLMERKLESHRRHATAHSISRSLRQQEHKLRTREKRHTDPRRQE